MEALALSPDGSSLATAVGIEVRLWETATGKPLGTLKGEEDPLASIRLFERFLALAYSPDGCMLAGGTLGMPLYLWDVQRQQLLRRLQAERDSVASLVFSPDGDSLALSTDYEDAIWIHDVRTGRPEAMLRGHRNSVTALAYSADGSTLVSGGRDGLVMTWDVRTRSLIDVFTPV